MTVKKFLVSVGASKMLEDPRLVVATAEIDGSPDRPRHQIQQDLARKEAARKQLARAHATAACSPDDILSAVYSLSDYNTYLLFNRDPVDRMIAYLRKYFDSRRCEDVRESLAITSGAQTLAPPPLAVLYRGRSDVLLATAVLLRSDQLATVITPTDTFSGTCAAAVLMEGLCRPPCACPY